MQNELTIEEQRVLTEALGECEEFIPLIENVERCETCWKLKKHHGIDFNDGRVTKRLMELVDFISVERWRGVYLAKAFNQDIDGHTEGEALTIGIAIAKAVYAYIVAKEG